MEYVPHRTESAGELTGTIGDKSAFDHLYVRITQEAIDCFVEGKRRKWALKLHGDLAAFDLYVGRSCSIVFSVMDIFPLAIIFD